MPERSISPYEHYVTEQTRARWNNVYEQALGRSLLLLEKGTRGEFPLQVVCAAHAVTDGVVQIGEEEGRVNGSFFEEWINSNPDLQRQIVSGLDQGLPKTIRSEADFLVTLLYSMREGLGPQVFFEGEEGQQAFVKVWEKLGDRVISRLGGTSNNMARGLSRLGSIQPILCAQEDVVRSETFHHLFQDHPNPPLVLEPNTGTFIPIDIIRPKKGAPAALHLILEWKADQTINVGDTKITAAKGNRIIPSLNPNRGLAVSKQWENQFNKQAMGNPLFLLGGFNLLKSGIISGDETGVDCLNNLQEFIFRTRKHFLGAVFVGEGGSISDRKIIEQMVRPGGIISSMDIFSQSEENLADMVKVFGREDLAERIKACDAGAIFTGTKLVMESTGCQTVITHARDFTVGVTRKNGKAHLERLRDSLITGASYTAVRAKSGEIEGGYNALDKALEIPVSDKGIQALTGITLLPDVGIPIDEGIFVNDEEHFNAVVLPNKAIPEDEVKIKVAQGDMFIATSMLTRSLAEAAASVDVVYGENGNLQDRVIFTNIDSQETLSLIKDNMVVQLKDIKGQQALYKIVDNLGDEIGSIRVESPEEFSAGRIRIHYFDCSRNRGIEASVFTCLGKSLIRRFPNDPERMIELPGGISNTDQDRFEEVLSRVGHTQSAIKHRYIVCYPDPALIGE